MCTATKIEQIYISQFRAPSQHSVSRHLALSYLHPLPRTKFCVPQETAPRCTADESNLIQGSVNYNGEPLQSLRRTSSSSSYKVHQFNWHCFSQYAHFTQAITLINRKFRSEGSGRVVRMSLQLRSTYVGRCVYNKWEAVCPAHNNTDVSI